MVTTTVLPGATLVITCGGAVVVCEPDVGADAAEVAALVSAVDAFVESALEPESSLPL